MAGRPKGLPKTGGRKKGTPNRRTALLKDAILEAAESAGGKAGIVGYLTRQAAENPAAFMTLLGKTLPSQLQHGQDPDNPLPTSITLNIVRPDGPT